MNEEQAVLDFFSQEENLSLGLSVAEQMDRIREQLNNRFWVEFQQHLDNVISVEKLPWRINATEDNNSQDSLVGLHLIPLTEQSHYLSPMIEQQFIGGNWRIYFGLMWSAPPSSSVLGLPDIRNLKAALQETGYKSNEIFPGWQWTKYYPRRRDFLIRFSQEPERLLDELGNTIRTSLLEHNNLLAQANLALQHIPATLSDSLAQMRNQLVD